MNSKKRFALLLCALLVFTSAISSSVFAESKKGGGTGQYSAHIKLDRPLPDQGNKTDLILKSSDGRTLYGVYQGQQIKIADIDSNAFDLNTTIDVYVGTDLIGTLMITAHEGNDTGTDHSGGSHEPGLNNYNATFVPVGPPVDPPIETGKLIIHKTANQEGTYTFTVGKETVNIPVSERGKDTQSSELELPAGTYTVSETDASKAGYDLKTTAGLTANPTEEKSSIGNVAIVAGETTHVYFDNEYTEIPEQKLVDVTFTKELVVAKDSLNPEFGDGITFNFVLSDGKASYPQQVTFTEIGAKGVTFKDVAPGTYTLTETNVPGWTSSIAEGVTVTVTEDGNVTIDGGKAEYTVTNTYNEQREPVDVTFTKELVVAKDSLKPDFGDGITFNFTLTSENGLYTQGVTFKDSESMKVTFENVLPGTYKLTETNLPAGWTSSIAKGVTVTVTEDGTVTFDKDSAEYTVTNTYDVKEEPINVTFTKELVVAKDSLNPEFGDGITFSFDLSNSETSYSQNVTFTEIAAKGVTFKDVAPGEYTLTEKDVPAGWISSIAEGVIVTVAEDGTVTFADGQKEYIVTNTYDVKEEPVYGAIIFRKVLQIADGSSQPLMPADGLTCKFVLQEIDGDFKVTQTVKVSGPDGVLVVFDKLPPGRYTLSEVEMATGWTSSLGIGVTIAIGDNGELSYPGGVFEVVTNTYNVTPPPVDPPVTPPVDPPVTPPVDPPVVPTPDPDPDPQPLPDDEFLEDPDPEDNNGNGGDTEKPRLPEDEYLEIDKEADPDQPKTGDEQNVTGWLAIMLLALAGMGVTVSTKRKSEDERN